LTINLADNVSAQINFNTMYAVMGDLLDRFYSEREITVTSSDPDYVTPVIIIIMIIIISKTMFTVLSSWQSHCESSPGSFDECM